MFPRMAVLLFVGVFSFGWNLIIALEANAYSGPTHRKIVIDAVDYIIASSKQKAPYVDGSTGQSDYELARAALAPGLGDSAVANRRLREAAAVLAEASTDTDRFQDVWLKLPGFITPSYSASVAGISFTTFSHFVNVHTPGLLWDVSGYYFGWVDQNQRCSDPGYEDLIANFLIENAEATVEVRKTEPVVRYRDPLRPTVTPSQYSDHFNQAIRYIHFWPVTNLANYWFGQFAGSPISRDRTPFNLPWLGPFLHALADSTVPYHASGLSGCGHGVYEDVVESLYDAGQLNDQNEVRRQLSTAGHLKLNSTVAEIVLGNARAAADPRFCQCTTLSCDCPVVKNEKAARELLNLAIASTVMGLRKAFSEWNRQGISKVAQGEAVRVSGQGPDPWRVFYRNVAEVPIRPPSIIAADPSYGAAMRQELIGHLREMNKLVYGFSFREIAAEPFRTKFESIVGFIAGVVIKFPNATWSPVLHEVGTSRYQGLPSLGDFPIRYRLPRLQEIRGEKEWMSYRDERRRFFAARGLYSTGELRAALQGRLQMKLSDQEKRETQIYISGLRKVQEAYISSLGTLK